jgi:hypothetical protein
MPATGAISRTKNELPVEHRVDALDGNVAPALTFQFGAGSFLISAQLAARETVSGRRGSGIRIITLQSGVRKVVAHYDQDQC